MNKPSATPAVLVSAPTTSDKPAKAPKPKCISVTREDAIRSLIGKLHHEVKEGCAEMSENLLFPPTFNSLFDRDGFKGLIQQAWILTSQATDVRWGEEKSALSKAVSAVVDTYQGKARAAKVRIDAMLAACEDEEEKALMPKFPKNVKVPFTALVGCFPTGTEKNDILVKLFKLYPDQIVNGVPKAEKREATPEDYSLSIPFQAEAPVVATAPTATDKAPESGEQPASKAA